MTNQDKFELAKSLLLDFKKYVVWIHRLAQGTEYDMMPCHIQICDTLQKYAEGRNEKRNLMINCPPGCLAGDSIISINRHKNGSTITIKDLYEKFNGLAGKWVSGPVYIRRAINGKVRLSKIEAVVYKGEQFTWEIVLEDGKRLRATGGHKIMVKDSFKKVEELKPGDLVAVDNKQIRGTGGRKTRLRDRDFVVGKLHPFGRWHSDCYRISLHRAVYEANANGLSLEDFRKRTYTNTDGMYFVPRDMHIHHIDGDHNNNTPDNLEILGCREHLLKHGLESNFGQGQVDYVAVKEILPGKIEPVYDIQCEEIEGCEPNYNANGILVHNTGKSLLIQYFITWCFARIKNSMFCYVAYGERLIKKLSRDSRNLMMMPEWEELFGKEMDPNDKSVLNYHLISGGVRSGLTAGTVSSAMLGLDAGVPGIDGFSGMLIMDDPNSPEVVSSVHEQIELPEVYQRKLATRRRTPTVPTFCVMQRHCFVPGTIIWTEDGKKTIEDIVENRYSGKVWSFNPFNRCYELRAITGYIKNPKLRQKTFNISGIECTGEHRVCTQRGVILARDVKAGDFLLYAPNSIDGGTRNIEFVTNLLYPIFWVAYYIKFIFSKLFRYVQRVFRHTGDMGVSRTVFDASNDVLWDAVFRSKKFNTVRRPGYIDSLFGCKFGIMSKKLKAAIVCSVIVVFPIRSVFKVIKFIIRWIVVKVSTNAIFRARANKCFKDNFMHTFIRMLVVFTKRYLRISPVASASNKTSGFTTKQSTKIRNFVKAFIANNIFENFVHPITSIKVKTRTTATYCITVENNYTLVAGATQGIIFGNCVNDFAGWVAKNEPDEWEWVVIPAIDAEGNSFYPKRYPIEELRRLEKQNPFMFAAMYQQCPVENYGAYFHEEWIRTYRATPEKFSKVFITTDFGFTTSGDKSLFCCWGLANDNNLYLLRSRVGKWESPDAKRYCVEFFNHCNAAFRQCRRVYVENTLSGLGFIQEMRRECPQMAIVPLKRGAKKNKLNRAESAMTWMEAGRVYFREADPNYVGARAELLAYNPADKNPKDEWVDNIGDSTEIAFNMKTSSIFI